MGSGTVGLWGGQFGNDYIERNRDVGDNRGAWWLEFLKRHQVKSALEIGCNIGVNLRWLVDPLGADNVTGVDVNRKALDEVRVALPGANLIEADGSHLPFDDDSFDLVFTTGVLIHQQPGDGLEAMMSEVVRCSSRLVMCGEYHAPELKRVNYVGSEAMYRADFGALYLDAHPELELLEESFHGGDEGWDDLVFWVLGKGAKR